MSIDIKKKRVADAVMAFQKDNLYEDSVHLFQALDYNTSRTMGLKDGSFKSFNAEFEAEKEGFNKQRALTDDWKEIQLLFQLTADEMMDQLPMFHATVNRDEPASFLFFAIELSSDEYSRSKLADIAREVNKPFKMDVFLLFKYGNYITLSLIERRPNKKFYDKDVIEKVTHIYNVNVAKPHAGHIHILNSFSFESLAEETKRKRFENFKDLQIAWKKAVSTKLLNKQFYKEYSRLSTNLIRVVYPRQIDNKLAAHQGILNLLNRIMFIYFVQKKEWLMKDQDFMINFWNRYLEEGNDGKNLFHQHWLSTVFFHAFNNELYNSKSLKYIPEDLQSAFTYFPYLNGGLFSYHKDYDHFVLEDKNIHDIFEFFEGYIFTITEDTPYDVNLEINPELLGKMYEGMINATDLDDVDAEHGIIYTERPEINFMVRRSLVEVLDKKLNPDTDKKFEREFLYHFVFDTPAEKLQLLRKKKTDVNSLRNSITTLTACDPACGSGSMLLGLLTVQMEMLRVIDEYLGTPHKDKDDFIIKKQLISECIYGVDVKEWAVRIAELRLWLYMISEAEFTLEQLIAEPLLPNLDFKLRTGNSLIQKFGDLDFTIEDLFKGKKKSTGAVKQLHDYIKRKKAFIQNQSDSNITFDQLKQEERAVFRDLITEMITEKQTQLKNKSKQTNLFITAIQKELFEEENLNAQKEIERLKKLRDFIRDQRKLPFSYDLDFMEIFSTNEDNPGFDLVIGNPPYVKESELLPPDDAEYLEHLMEKDKDGKYLNNIERRAANLTLKRNLSDKVYSIYPFLRTEVNTIVNGQQKKIHIYGNKINAKSDLYVYFQLICPHYLNKSGTFCFIISNSWLDVDFGALIQQFLIRHTKLKAIYDSSVRSFDAGVNTIIYLHGKIEIPRLKGGKKMLFDIVEPSNNMTRFILNKIDYTQSAYAPLLIDQEGCSINTITDFYRCLPITQTELHNIGYDNDEAKYSGEKWYGLFFKSPEIFIKLNSNDRFIPLGEVGVIKLGITSCQNDYFYISKEMQHELLIENEYLKPIFKTPQEVETIAVDTKNLKYQVLLCDVPKKNLKGTAIEKYIKHGERNGINDVACLEGRSLWYNIGYPEKASVIIPYSYGEVFKTYFSESGVICDKRLVTFKPNNEIDSLLFACLLNSSLWFLFVETYGSSNLGEGALVFNTKNFRKLKIPNVYSKLNNFDYKTLFGRPVNSIFIELGFDQEKEIRAQPATPLEDRKILDNIIFDELRLTSDERNEVYWSLAELVKQRIDKASSR